MLAPSNLVVQRHESNRDQRVTLDKHLLFDKGFIISTNWMTSGQALETCSASCLTFAQAKYHHKYIKLKIEKP